MAATHPASLGELVVWMVEDAKVNRVRGGGMLGVPADVLEPSAVTR